MAFQGDSIFWVDVEKVVPNPFQPRREFNKDKLQELAESVRMYGILQPLTVTRKEIQRDDGAFYTEYELIAGERRLRASKLAGIAQVPVIIREGQDTEQEKLELAIIENLQREDLNAVDRALAFQQLADAFKLSHGEVAKKVGRSRMYVSNTIRLLGLPEVILASLRIADISEGHARTLLMLKDRPEEQDVVYREILLKKLSVREVERIVRKIATDKVRKKSWKGTDPHLIEIEKEFTHALGTRVQIAKTDYGGKVTIDYFSEEDLQKLLLLMKQEQEKEKDTAIPEEASATVVQSMSAVAATTPLEEVTEEGAITPHVDTDEVFSGQIDKMQIQIGEINDLKNQIEKEVEAQTQTVPSIVDETEVSVKEAVESEEATSDVREEMIIMNAQEAGAEVGRPTPEEKVENSSTLQQEVQEQITDLAKQEVEYTPPADTSGLEPKEKKDSDDTDLYSMKNFSL